VTRPATRRWPATRRAAPHACAAALAFALCGCATPPEPLPPAPASPAGWRAPSAAASMLTDRPWGEVFRSERLEALIRESLSANQDLQIAAERIELARARYGVARSALFPSIGADASYTRQQQPVAGASRNVDSGVAVLGLRVPVWEIDVWGRLRDLASAAQSDVQASEQLRRGVQVSLVAQVSALYVELIDLDAQLATAANTAASRRESLRIVQARFRAGIVSAIDVRQAESALGGAEATIAALESRRALAENAMSLLLGRSPGPIARDPGFPVFADENLLPAGIPSQVLQRRPDIAAAESRLAAAQADVSAARKAFLPAISLSGFLGLVSPQLGNLLEARSTAYSITPAVTLPIFTAGRLQADVDFAEASQRILLEEYARTTLNAFREVEDGLATYRWSREQRAALARTVSANRERLRLAELRYLGGVSIYFEVLDAQRQLFDSELQLSRSIRDTYVAVVQVYAALGGAWDPQANP